ncbi:ABC transporter ATP-binding protein [Nonomuraea sp. NN258]|uniref:ABC transporter ATP-binding protein n=1 Tax=Nonomuraea antri TaxID=2730852 RepID=UPI001568AFF9|nr:ABC transporter ATP-binding protein [Nonomuraea antri]NRQ39486.1 ABC transporter ATP-binding protein [Nonomuraea antri]
MLKLIEDRRALVRYASLLAVSALVRAGTVLSLIPLLSALFAGEAALPWIALLAVLVAAGWALDHRVARAGFTIGFELLNGLEKRLLDRLRRTPLGWFTAERTSAGRRALTSSGRELCQAIAWLVTPAVNALLTPALIGLGLLPFAPALGLVALAAVPVLLAAMWASMRCVRAADDAYAAASAQAGERIIELARAQRALRAAGRAGTEGTAVGRALARQRAATLRLVGFGLPGQLMFGLATQAVLVALAATAVLSELSAAQVVALLIVAVRFIEPFTTLAELSPALQNLRGTLARVRDLLNAPVLEGAPLVPEPGAPALELRDVRFGYEPGHPVLDGVSFTVERGTTTAVVGPSGAGKSTLLSLIARFHEVDAGAVLVGGHDVRGYDPAVLMARLGIVFQDVYLFESSLRENVLLGDPGADDERFRAAAGAARLDELVERLPDGWDTRVGERGATLSGGERQRVSIARALLKDAPILLLDEATAALDTGNERAVVGALESGGGDRATLIVAHRLSTIARADQIVFLEGGRVAEIGTPAELLARDGRFAAYWRHREQAAGWSLVH